MGDRPKVTYRSGSLTGAAEDIIGAVTAIGRLGSIIERDDARVDREGAIYRRDESYNNGRTTVEELDNDIAIQQRLQKLNKLREQNRLPPLILQSQTGTTPTAEPAILRPNASGVETNTTREANIAAAEAATGPSKPQLSSIKALGDIDEDGIKAGDGSTTEPDAETSLFQTIAATLSPVFAAKLGEGLAGDGLDGIAGKRTAEVAGLVRAQMKAAGINVAAPGNGILFSAAELTALAHNYDKVHAQINGPTRTAQLNGGAGTNVATGGAGRDTLGVNPSGLTGEAMLNAMQAELLGIFRGTGVTVTRSRQADGAEATALGNLNAPHNSSNAWTQKHTNPDRNDR